MDGVWRGRSGAEKTEGNEQRRNTQPRRPGHDEPWSGRDGTDWGDGHGHLQRGGNAVRSDRTAIGDRRRMVRRQLAARDITDRRVLAAFSAVPREHFVPARFRDVAYGDHPLPIGLDQTISQPYIVALMTQHAHVNRTSRVLEIGTGSGYQTAILAAIANHVWSVERIHHLAADARERLRRLTIHNVTVISGDGARGHAEEAPYDAIIVTAAAPEVPAPLQDQLGLGGRLVIPVGKRAVQELMIIERSDRGYVTHPRGACRFVPLVSPAAFRN